jgi:hypothetical protein
MLTQLGETQLISWQHYMAGRQEPVDVKDRSADRPAAVLCQASKS